MDFISIMCTIFINKDGMFFKPKLKNVNINKLQGFYMPLSNRFRDNSCHNVTLYFCNYFRM